MVQVVVLARLHEEKLADFCQIFSCRPTVTGSQGPPSSRPLAPLPSSALLPIPSHSLSIPFKRLSPEELTCRCEKGLCFNHDEKFSCGHHYSSKFFLLIVDEDDNPSDDPPDVSSDEGEALGPFPAQISLYALVGNTALETLCLMGRLTNQKV